MRAYLLFSLILIFVGVATSAPTCKCTYGSACWPSLSAWNSFNSSIGGRLLQPLPELYYCHQPNYNADLCNQTLQSYYSMTWRSDQPAAMQYTNFEVYNNTGCVDLDPTTPCNRGALPYYVVDAVAYSDVTAAVSFAAQNNIRLIVKNTGHCYLGRSSAAGALSIWTHHLNNMTFTSSFTPFGGSGSAGQAVILGPGTQWGDVYVAADAEGVVVVGGSQPTVSVGGGFLLGGGHSSISPTFGLAVDNVLQMTVVTADGQLRIANQYQNSDLFWALRGGGGSTFGVVVEVVYKTYPALDNIFAAAFVINSTTDDAFLTMFTNYVAIQPYWSDAGYASYTYVYNRTMLFVIMLPNTNNTFVQASLGQFFGPLKSMPEIQVQIVVEYLFPSFLSFYHLLEHDPTKGGYGVLIGSRLIPRTLFENNPQQLSSTIMDLLYNNIQQGGDQQLILHLVAGGQVSRNNDPNVTSVQPAWRTALWHVVTGYGGDSTIQNPDQILTQIAEQFQPLRDLTPGGGCYQNEASPREPNWQDAFFGTNYKKLLAIKFAYDPNSLFVCNECVGSEFWTDDLNCPIAQNTTSTSTSTAQPTTTTTTTATSQANMLSTVGVWFFAMLVLFL